MTTRQRTVFMSCFIVFIQALIAPLTNGTEQMSDEHITGRLQRFERLTDKERETLLRDIGQNLRQAQGILLTALDSGSEDAKFYAAYLLGEYRFPQAADGLARRITLEDKIRSTGQRSCEWFWDRYPAMEALIKIGIPSIPALIGNLEESDDATVRKLSLKVIYSIERDKEITTLRLQRALDTQKDSEKRARLQSALKSLSEMQPGN